MKELQTILKAIARTQTRGQGGAIATVVKTSGSVYRRPGARLLLTAAGEFVGSISGGCLETDVLEQAQTLLQQGGPPRLLAYDQTATADLVWGLGLGCNGIVEVLLESLATPTATSMLKFITDCLHQRQRGAIATVFRVEGHPGPQVTDRLLLRADGVGVNTIADQAFAAQLLADAYQVLAADQTQVKTYALNRGTVEVLLEVIQPPVQLLVFGAGYDAVPLVQLAHHLGWQTTVIDHRPTFAQRDRFPEADALVVCRPEDWSAPPTLTAPSAAVIMTHNYLHDQKLLRTLLLTPLPYIGLLGPKHRTQQLLADLNATGFQPTPSQLQRLYGPVGLDLGAETPEEIALAIAAEIQAVLSQRSSGHLRERQGPIHPPQPCPAWV